MSQLETFISEQEEKFSDSCPCQTLRSNLLHTLNYYTSVTPVLSCHPALSLIKHSKCMSSRAWDRTESHSQTSSCWGTDFPSQKFCLTQWRTLETQQTRIWICAAAGCKQSNRRGWEPFHFCCDQNRSVWTARTDTQHIEWLLVKDTRGDVVSSWWELLGSIVLVTLHQTPGVDHQTWMSEWVFFFFSFSI